MGFLRDNSLEEIVSVNSSNCITLCISFWGKTENQAKARFVFQNHGTLQKDALLHFWMTFLNYMRLNLKKYNALFRCPFFCFMDSTYKVSNDTRFHKKQLEWLILRKNSYWSASFTDWYAIWPLEIESSNPEESGKCVESQGTWKLRLMTSCS